MLMAFATSGAFPATPPPEPDLGGLIRRAAAGDQRAFAELYDRTNRLVYSVVFRIVADPSDAEEVTLDVYNQVWRSAASYDAGRSAPATWLIMTARSRALDRIRSRTARSRHEAPLDPGHDSPSPEGGADQTAWFAQRRKLVLNAIGQLQPDQRQLIELSFFEGLSHSEMAARLNQPLGTVKTRVRSGLTKLRQALADTVGYSS
ncbi:MAG: sigma-70 family RNA polymerase sigma factor [Bryobacteraceae bacterium]